jgi:hypothetical protein
MSIVTHGQKWVRNVEITEVPVCNIDRGAGGLLVYRRQKVKTWFLVDSLKALIVEPWGLSRRRQGWRERVHKVPEGVPEVKHMPYASADESSRVKIGDREWE